MNTLVISGNLTRDPELREIGDTCVAEIGVAVNERKKQGDDWVDVAHFFDVSVFGRKGEILAEKATKGDFVTVQGKLRYSSWENEDGDKRSKVSIVGLEVEGEYRFRPAGGGVQTESKGKGKASTSTSTRGKSKASRNTAADDDIPF